MSEQAWQGIEPLVSGTAFRWHKDGTVHTESFTRPCPTCLPARDDWKVTDDE